MTTIASVFPLLSWLLYAALVDRLERRRPSLSLLMSVQRRRWVANAAHRETPMDALLSANLMHSVSFFASTTVLIILALFAVFGQSGAVLEAVNGLGGGIALIDLQVHVAAMLVMFVLAFLCFTLSLRQFNHFCIMLGAVDHASPSDDEEIAAITALNTLGARNFNQGIRAYHFAIAALAWFAVPWAAILVSLVTVGMLLYREFFSTPRRLIEKMRTR